MITHNTLSSVILRDSCAWASNFQWRGLEGKKKKKSLLRLKSTLAKLLSFHQKQETDGRAQLQKVLRLLWKNYAGVCCKQGCQHSAAVLHGATAQCQWMDGLTAHAAHGDAILERNLPGVTPSSQWCTLPCSQDLLTVVEEEECIKDSLCS